MKQQLKASWPVTLLHTDSEADLLLLIGQSIIIVEIKLQSFELIGQQLPLQAKQHAEVAFTAHHPNGVKGRLQISSYLKYKDIEQHRENKFNFNSCIYSFVELVI